MSLANVVVVVVVVVAVVAVAVAATEPVTCSKTKKMHGGLFRSDDRRQSATCLLRFAYIFPVDLNLARCSSFFVCMAAEIPDKMASWAEDVSRCNRVHYLFVPWNTRATHGVRSFTELLSLSNFTVISRVDLSPPRSNMFEEFLSAFRENFSETSIKESSIIRCCVVDLFLQKDFSGFKFLSCTM